MTTRRSWICLAAAVFATHVSAVQAQTKWDLATPYPISNPHTLNLQEFATAVSQATGDKLKIALHPNGSLFKGNEIKRAVQTNQVQAGEVFMSSLENENPLYGLDAVPFVATNFDAARKLWKAQRAAVEQTLARQGMRLLYAVAWPPQGLFAKKPIATMADLKGLKMRTNNVATSRIAQGVGAQSVNVQAAELAQALATGVVDSFLSSGATGVDTKVWETLNHFYSVDAWFPKNMVFVNERAFAELEPAVREQVLKAAAAAEQKGWERMVAYTQVSLQTLGSNGMKVQKPNAEVVNGLRQVSEELKTDWAKRAGPEGQAILGAYAK
ncbi:MAG: TRAP transporter substrate-binding protein [Burkholderiaceae bacterium]|nr:TRAP transporter substrate-binding protein [Burkholderiaceae bacterium]